ncbi:MAG: ABC transporter permease [Treponema sp.]|jgi:ABC-2 type transport system permease protein|nr:ABC transporter permease [Treponema sp.]
MKAIIKRELASYFTSPIGYIYLAVIYFLSGYFLFTIVLINNSNDIRAVFQSMLTIVMFCAPLLTMRLMSEDKRRKTDQTLLTAPVSLTGIVFGKFFAAALMYLASISVLLVFALVLHSFSPVNWAVIIGNFAGLLLLGLVFIAIGLFVSSLTENQAIAAIGSFVVMLGLFMLDAIPTLIPNPVVTALIREISVLRRYTPITQGILGIADLVFFISVSGIFLFLTARVLEKRRWS